MRKFMVGGKYQHYKGHVYKVLGVAKHSETLAELIVYVSLNDPEDLWVRPKMMFLGKVTLHGQTVPRFKLVP